MVNVVFSLYWSVIVVSSHNPSFLIGSVFSVSRCGPYDAPATPECLVDAGISMNSIKLRPAWNRNAKNNV